MRDEWLALGRSTRPVDRDRAEAAVVELYRVAGAARPAFVWVPSPAAALPLIPDDGRESAVAVSIAASAAGLRARAEARTDRRHLLWWQAPVQTARTLPPEEALARGVPLGTVLAVAVHEPLHTALWDGLVAPTRTALLSAGGRRTGFAWYGSQDAYWAAGHDIRRRLGHRVCEGGDGRLLDLWMELARTAGWWWPREEVCVMAERPVEVRTEPLPGARFGEVRLHDGRGPAVRYADGTEVYALHGVPVSARAVTAPSAAVLHRETRMDARHAVMERIGWEAYVEQAGLPLVAAAPDPGNPGCELRLYHLPQQIWGRAARLLLAVDGSAGPDGGRRAYGLSVPADIDDPVSAAGWTYGLSGDQYAGLARRT
ncbi:DUF6745 domain-containing protein [Streptomyces sp. NPDC014894]|uniref:DUF6745 domain-containing protein n=1 Tax=Streptomyces sp. NPDC014894 TaxID=3364931 RepID=UPI0036F6F2E8